ncbi:uncharacterized protein LOC135094070 isoform X1 [Scylla paramamosain]|uniref:uncharacterized protein LOC135094070 isoform X1 n=1 Tax=Scylla paramamosain TaxID=85552 RepID=UPI00308331E9
MASRYFTIHIALLTALTLASLYSISSRYYQQQEVNSLLTMTCYNTSTSSKVDSTSRDGAFYSAADIAKPDEDWGKKTCPVRELNDLNDFYEYIFTRRVPCDFKMILGGRLLGKSSKMDGEKWVCMDKQYNISPRNCLVFSFGIGSDWSFENDVENKLGCKVFAFDPTINKRSQRITELISFFNLGIGDSNRTAPEFKVKTNSYGNILNGLGHLNSIVDILKIDVEGSELRFFKDVLEGTPSLLKNVKFIAMEVHIQGKIREFWKYFQLLDCFGFKIWYSAINPFVGGSVVNGRQRGCCYEIVWVQDRSW